MGTRQELEQFLKLAIPKVTNNVEIVSTKDLGQDYFLHISPTLKNIKYIPQISRRQEIREDRTIPRITVAPTLLGCYIGYTKGVNDVITFTNEKEEQQGWRIHELKFDFALKPSNRLVYDSSRSDEHWLVTYSKDTLEYPSTLAAKAFIEEIRFVSQSGKPAEIALVLYVGVEKKEGIRFSKNHFLNKGYWKIEGPADVDQLSWDKDKDFQVTAISKEDYESTKKRAAAMLSERVGREEKPSFAKW